MESAENLITDTDEKEHDTSLLNLPILYITGDKNDFFTATETNLGERLITAGFDNIKTIIQKNTAHGYNKHPFQYLNVNMEISKNITEKSNYMMTFKTESKIKNNKRLNSHYTVYLKGTSKKNIL